MPRYYFQLHNDIDVPDDEGKELPDLNAACDWAACSARMVMGQTLKEEGTISLKHRIDVEDEQHAVLATVWFKDAVQVRG